uniref:Integrase n=1 Tax=Siphoviridae sp. ctnMR5 TaxID=2825658 RepID=A0A8S5U903_9CAUD|nr:MAG TPA: Integrase [Siphoviridae sp. ctnMR5]
MNAKQFEIASEQYITALPSMGKSKRTATAYDLAFRKFNAYLAEQQVDEIIPLTVINWRSALSGENIKSNTTRQYMFLIHSFFEWAIKMKITTENPVLLDEIPQPKQIEHDLLTIDEIKKILTVKPTSPMTGARNRAIIILLLQTGLRNSELRALTLDNIDFANSRIVVEHGKGDKKRYVPLPELAKECIQDYLRSPAYPPAIKSSDTLFGNDIDENGHHTNGAIWRPFNITKLNDLVRRYTAKVCGHSVHTHILRHAFTSLCDYSGMPMTEISQNLGHANPIITAKVYRHILDKDTAVQAGNKAMNKILDTLTLTNN